LQGEKNIENGASGNQCIPLDAPRAVSALRSAQ
jgi:hypothetical protein